MSNDFPACGRCRVVIERVRPAIDSGRFPIKRVIGQEVAVEADIFADGHDQISAMLRFRPVRGQWQEVLLHPLGNDRWRGAFVADALGLWEYSIVAWVDRFLSWRHDLAKRVAAGQDVRVDLQIGAALVEQAATHACSADAEQLRALARALTDGVDGVSIAQSPELALLMTRNAARAHAAHVTPPLPVVVEPLRAGFSAWYELFPRSLATIPGTHGTLADVERVLPEIAALGFDVLYLPPIHPIGRVQRK
ncbi:MAG: alpha-1,4-glucan--maltose-1-phosphate maltosyltransferase, partial [Chloroflexi bacterium]